MLELATSRKVNGVLRNSSGSSEPADLAWGEAGGQGGGPALRGSCCNSDLLLPRVWTREGVVMGRKK